MEYANIKQANFISRPNRFIADIEIDGKTEIAHVKNTGPCKELLTPNATVFVQAFDNPNRKTKYDVISVYKGHRLINIDNQIPNKIFSEWIQHRICLKILRLSGRKRRITTPALISILKLLREKSLLG